MKSLKKLFTTFLLLCVVIASVAGTGITSANAEIQTMYDQHIFEEGSNVSYLPIPKTYTVRNTIRTIESSNPDKAVFKTPSDMFIDDNDNIYIVDTGENRIVKMDSWGNVILEVTEIIDIHSEDEECDCEIGEKRKFDSPQGIFVDSDEDIYVADTKNERIVHLDKDGYFVEYFTKPNDESLVDYRFDVKKLAISDQGVIYVLLETDFQGFIMMNSKGEYIGNTGMTRTTSNFVEMLWSKITSTSDVVKAASYVAPPYNNFMIDDNGWIYATIGTVEKDQIAKLNSAGTNIYGNGKSGKQYGRNYYKITDLTTYDTEHYVSNFIDIDVDADGILYVLDDTLGNVFLYDQEGNNLAYFGEKGTNRGKFGKPVAIGVLSNGDVAVLDSKTGYVTVFKPTKFCNLMKEGTTLYRNAEYDKAREIWTELLEIDANYIYAHKAIGKAYLKEKNYQAAMVEYKLAKDKEGYSEAFEAQKEIYTKKYFFVLVLIIAVLIVGFVLGYRKLRKYVDKLHFKVTTWGGDDE